MMTRRGHALGCFERRTDGQAIGMYGLLKRDDQAVAAVRDPCRAMTAQHAIRKRRIGPALPR
jgi:hypothetical protein